MLLKAGLFFLGVAVLQVSAEFIPVTYIENVVDAEPSDQRIVSGWEAQPGQHPHHVSIRMVNPLGIVSACGGSVVSRHWVVTAAHCTATRITIVVRAGVVNLTNPEYISESTEWYNYPTFNDNAPTVVQPNDISLLKVESPFVYTRLLKPIRIQSRAEMYKGYEDLQLYASGHGTTWTAGSTTEVLNWVYLWGVTDQSCRDLFGASIVTENTVCARFFNVTSQSTCQGDSGGPLVHVNSDGVPVLIGVASFVAGGSFGCHSGLPAGFIRPGPFLDWFQQISGIDFENLNEDEDDESTAPPEDDNTTETPDEDSDSDSSESDEDDDEMSQIMKKLVVKVNVKVSVNKNGKVKHEVEKEVEKHH